MLTTASSFSSLFIQDGGQRWRTLLTPQSDRKCEHDGQLAHRKPGTVKIVQNYANIMQSILVPPTMLSSTNTPSLISLCIARKQWRIIGTEQFATIFELFYAQKRCADDDKLINNIKPESIHKLKAARWWLREFASCVTCIPLKNILHSLPKRSVSPEHKTGI